MILLSWLTVWLTFSKATSKTYLDTVKERLGKHQSENLAKEKTSDRERYARKKALSMQPLTFFDTQKHIPYN